MDYLFDIIMIAVMALSIFIGYKRVLIMTVFSLAAVVISIAVACKCGPYVSDFLADKGLNDKFAEKTASKIEKIYSDNVESELKLSCADVAERMKLPGAVNRYLDKKIDSFGESAVMTETVNKLSYEIADISIKLISCAAVAIVTAAILIAIVMLVKLVRFIPQVKKFDNGGGAIFGALRGVLVIFIICLAVYAAAILTGSSFADGIMDKSVIIGLIDKTGAFALIL